MGQLTRVMASCVLFCVVEYWYWTGVLLFTFAQGGATLAGIVMLAQLIPAALLAAPLGTLGDRLPRGRALSGAYASQAIALALLAALMHARAPLAAIVVASALATVFVSVARPIHHAALPQLATTPERLVRANSGSGIADGVGVFVGPLLAGVMAQQVGYASIPAASAVAMLIAAVLTLRLGLPRTPPWSGTGHESHDNGWLSGLRIVRADTSIFVLLLMVGVAYVVMGSLELLNVAFATDILDGGESVSGLLIGAVGIGLFIGSLLAAVLAIRAHLSPVIIVSYLAAGVPLLCMAATGAMPPALLWLAVCGTGLAISSVAVRTLLQRTSDVRVLGRVFAVQEALMMLGLAVGAIVGPACLAWLGPDGAYVAVGLGLVLIALIAIPSLRRLDLRVVLRPDVLAAIRRVPFLAALQPPEGERLAQTAEWVDVPTGSVVIAQGDHGDAFFIVDRGRLAIVKDGARLPYDMEPGQGFGELALLRDAPRAATVTALEPCRLLRIERDDFLAAVTGVADGSEVARQVAHAFHTRVAESSG